jgi:site-specific recombinase XerD
VEGEDIDRLIEGINGKKNHKNTIDREVLLVETARMTGLRRGELSVLKVGDLHLNGVDPVLIVRQSKESKDRSVNLNDYMKDKLAVFTRGKPASKIFYQECGLDKFYISRTKNFCDSDEQSVLLLVREMAVT